METILLRTGMGKPVKNSGLYRNRKTPALFRAVPVEKLRLVPVQPGIFRAVTPVFSTRAKI